MKLAFAVNDVIVKSHLADITVARVKIVGICSKFAVDI